MPCQTPNTGWRIDYLETLLKEPQNSDLRAVGSSACRYLGLRLFRHGDAGTGSADSDTCGDLTGLTDCNGADFGAVDRWWPSTHGGPGTTDRTAHRGATATPIGGQTFRHATGGPERVGALRRQPNADRQPSDFLEQRYSDY